MPTNDDEPVPLFKRWLDWYVLVIGLLVALIGFFYFFTKHFA